ncbi:MAG: energy-coupling factor transporter transmembrane protein EcfT [Treponema sp.]|nr:energy-coupling factor transporter transmembrane protein EcfT [Treponema sp.]
MSDFLSKVNPCFKLAAALVCSTALAFTRSLELNAAVFAACVVLLALGAGKRQWLQAAKILIPVTLFAFSIFMTGARFGNDVTGGFFLARFTQASFTENLAENLASIKSAFILPSRLYAFAALGLVFSLTTDPCALVKSLRKDARLSRKFAYGMLCAINLLPYITTEYKNARLAFEVRGVRLTIFSLKPVFSMMVNSFRWSEVLSMAMFSKGFHEP